MTTWPTVSWAASEQRDGVSRDLPGAATATAARRGVTTGNVTVDGHRRSRLARREAADVAVVSRRALHQESRDLSDALDLLPGLHVVRVGGHGAATHVQVRGATAAQTLVALGDIPLRSPTGRPVDLEAIPVLALGSIEVWRSRGPASLGDTPIGGVIRLRPRKTGPGAEARAGYGSYGATLVEARGAWGQRHGDGGSASARWLTGDGDFPYLHDAGTPLDPSDDYLRRRGNNRVRRLSGLLRHRLHLGRRWRVGLTWLGGWRSQGLPGLAVAEATRANAETHHHNVILRGSNNRAGHATEVWAHAATEQLNVQDRLGELGPVQARTQDVRAGELGVRWRLGRGAIRPRAALAARLGGIRTDDQLTGRASPQATQAAATLSLGADLRGERWRVSPTVRATGIGSRRYEDQGWVAHWTTVDAPTRALLSGELGGAVHLTPRWVARVGLGLANRAPTLVELFGNDGTVRPAPRLRDERALTATCASELRLGRDTRGGTLAISGFLSDRTDLIQLVRAGPGQAIHTNVGHATVVGAEVATTGQWGDHLFAQASWAVLRGRDQSADPAYDGNALPLRPASRWHGAVALRRLRVATHVHAGLRVATRWQAGSFADRANLVVIPARAEVDASADLTAGHWRASLRLDNAFDAARFDRVGLPLPGRVWMLNLAWRMAESS